MVVRSATPLSPLRDPWSSSLRCSQPSQAWALSPQNSTACWKSSIGQEHGNVDVSQLTMCR